MSQRLGTNVKAARLLAGLSQSALADGIMSASYLSLVEAGKREPSEDLLRKLAVRLNVPVTELMHGVTPAALGNALLDINSIELLIGDGDGDRAETAATALIDRLPVQLGPQFTAQLYRLRAQAAATQGKFAAAADDARTAHELSRSIGDVYNQTQVAIELMRYLRDQGDVRAAVALGEELAPLFSGPVIGTALHAGFLTSYIETHARLRNMEQASAAKALAREVFGDKTDPRNQVAALNSEGQKAGKVADLARALLLTSLAVEMSRTGGQCRLVGRMHTDLAFQWIYHETRDLEAADHHARLAESILLPYGQRTDVARLYGMQAALAEAKGDFAQAREFAAKSVTALDGHPGNIFALQARLFGCIVELNDGKLDAARALTKFALAEAQRFHHTHAHSVLWQLLGKRYAELGHAEDALQCFEQALIHAQVGLGA